MLSRRTALAACAIFSVVRQAVAADETFGSLLDQAREQPDLMEQALALRDGPAIEFEVVAERAVAPRFRPSDKRLSDDAINMIIVSEVSSQARYESRYRAPVWPGGQSGVTVGIGYDVGYSTPAWLQEDWSTVLAAADLATLQKACKVTGEPAHALIQSFDTIQIPWDQAFRQFTTISLPRWTAETLANLPNADKLSPDCLGALVSIDYNRGPAWKLTDDRHREMRAIRLHMVNEQYTLIPAEIRSMTRLWEGDPASAGLVIRRKLEAALFEKGLRAS